MRRKFTICARQSVILLMCTGLFGSLTITGVAKAQTLAADSIENLQRLSIEQLANLQVTSVSKVPESLSDAPAAVYVITHDDIIRSGARRIPDMLRLAPNLEVFQTSPDNYVITARGLSGNTAAQNFSNKVEVLIDGRTVYNPLFSGVYWEMLGEQAQFGNLSPSVSGFYILYTDLRSIEVTPGTITPLFWGNGIQGHVYGLESWGSYQATAWWRLDAGLTVLHEHFGFARASET